MGNIILKNIFPRFFSLSVKKDVLLELCGAWVNCVWVLNLVWRRSSIG